MLTSSKNILAVEYLKAIIKNNYAIKPYTIKRQGDDYNDTDIRSDYASATALRGNLKADNISKYIPVKAGLILSSNTNYIYSDDITEALFTRLLDILFASSYDKNVFIENVMKYPDVNKEIAGRLYKSAMDMITRTVPHRAGSKDNEAFSFGSLCEHNVKGGMILVSTEQIRKNLVEKAEWLMQHIREKEWISAGDDMGWFNGNSVLAWKCGSWCV